MMFDRFCSLHNLKPVPASPVTIARFINGIAELGIDRVWEAVQEISRSHYTIGLSDPTLGSGLVTSAINAISNITPPRSWSGPLKLRFLSLPYDIQRQIADREVERENTVRKAFNERDEARKQLKEMTNGKKSDAA
jgi:hypothetical protein